jgi:amidase
MGSVLDDLDATDLADLVRSGKLSALELVESAIARAERMEPALSAFATPAFDQAREAARSFVPSGPFCGVPFVVKDLAASCAGLRITEGSRLLGDHVAKRDSELVARFRRAGLIVIGLSTASELGTLPSAETLRFGATKNPWDPTRHTGGSSGGSAALVAAGVVPMAHANDFGGSIRIPAACCGLFGLKPTRARTPLGPDFGDLASGLVHQHAVTRSVRDSARLLDATRGMARGDPYSAPSPVRAYSDEVAVDPDRLRIAFYAGDLGGAPVHADCQAALRDAVALLGDLGHELIELDRVVERPDVLTGNFVAVLAAHVGSTLLHWSRVLKKAVDRDLVEPHNFALFEMGKSASSSDYLAAIQALQRIARDLAERLSEYDLLLTPTLAEPPLALGELAPNADVPLMPLFRAGAYTPFTPLANVTGCPAMSVPLYWNGAGLPIGVHFMAPFGDEAMLFRLAGQLERARPWRPRRPSLHASTPASAAT